MPTMNQIYKVIWSAVRNTYVAVAETTHAHGKANSIKQQIFPALVAGVLVAGGMSSSAYAAEGEISAGASTDQPDTSVAYGRIEMHGPIAMWGTNGFRGSGAKAMEAVALGSSSVVVVTHGTAIGYQSTANQSGTIAFGHDAGDVSVERSRRDGDVIFTTTESTYTSSYYNRLVKVADGQSTHDVATVGQTIELVAGDHVKVEADTTTTNAIGQQRKKISILVDGKIEKGNTGLVTGDAINTALNHAYGNLRNDISRAAASSNALAALKPMEFDPDDKLQFGIGYGHYHNANAAAVGAFYQPDENCMMNLGASLGNGNPGISAGITIKFGPGGSGTPTLSKKQMARIIRTQSEQLSEQSKEIELLKQANEKMMEQFKAMMDKLNK